MSLTVGSLFSGIGGFDLGLERAGCEIIAQVECDPFANRVLAAQWPHVTRWPDVREWTGDGHESVDLLCGGFPCQDLSVAGKRKGLTGERSALFWEIIRIAQAITPMWGLFENVPGLFSSGGGRDMASVLEGLRQCWPVVGYAVLDSQHFGVPQRRRRVFFVCGPTVAGVEQVLFESEGRSRDLAPGTEAGKDVAASLRSCSARSGNEQSGQVMAFQPQASSTQPMTLHRIAPTIGTTKTVGIVGTLTARDYKGVDRCDSSANIKLVVAACLNSAGNNGGFRTEPGEHLTINGQGVRRLTPTETERLQGFPDGWTCLCQPLESYDSNRCTCPDTPRYKVMGNAVTVPVIEWIGRRIVTQHLTALQKYHPTMK